MDQAYISALAALAGSLIGGLTSLTTTWLTQRAQFRAQRWGQDLGRREELYKRFIEEASMLYADAYEHDKADVSKFVNLYALISRMRIVSSPQIVEHADSVARVIIETYLSPNRSLRDLREFVADQSLNPLREFSNACRDELEQRRYR